MSKQPIIPCYCNRQKTNHCSTGITNLTWWLRGTMLLQKWRMWIQKYTKQIQNVSISVTQLNQFVCFLVLSIVQYIFDIYIYIYIYIYICMLHLYWYCLYGHWPIGSQPLQFASSVWTWSLKNGHSSHHGQGQRLLPWGPLAGIILTPKCWSENYIDFECACFTQHVFPRTGTTPRSDTQTTLRRCQINN